MNKVNNLKSEKIVLYNIYYGSVDSSRDVKPL